ncbi:MAG: hypothetical protein NZ700_11760 [Gemmataceae bacterium]|nr:hypothetical protein [Gemmataceae bacterium]MDW8266840.1 hypothetical protein [Gemmataceae bacterium]
MVWDKHWSWSVAACLSLGVTTASGGEPAFRGKGPPPAFGSRNPQAGLVKKLLAADRPSGRTPPAPSPATGREPVRPTATGTDAPPSKTDEAVATRLREQEALLRRLKVCDRLAEIACQTQDDDLQRMVEQLDERARATYAQRIAHLPCSSARFDSDEETLDRHLAPKATPSSAKLQPRGPATAREGTRRTAGGEGQP